MSSIFTRKILFFTSLLVTTTMLFTSCEKAAESVTAAQLDLPFVALTKDLMLQTYNANNPSVPTKSVKVTGLVSAETILGIDYRPATGQLYALGNTSTLYIINTNTGQATQVGNGPFSPAVSGLVTGFDFNPSVDRIRIVTATGQNMRVNPETGAVVSVDGSIKGAAGAIISGSAYTINTVVSSNQTVLYDIDVVAKKLYRQDPPNDGTLTEVGNLTIPASSGDAGFDIGPDGTALAAISNGGNASLYQIDLTNGAATNLGAFGSPVIGIAIPTESVAYAVDDANNLYSFFLDGPRAQIAARRISGITNLQPGESVLGIDFRPAIGRLYALGSTSRLYSVDLMSGVATQVGSGQFSTALSGTSFGFDFNPMADRIRVVSNTGQNLRIDPNTGLVAATDGMLNPGSPAVSAAAYTNNFPGTTSTMLYVIDHMTDSLYTQNPPNNGTLVKVGSLGVNAEASNGFDIGGTTGNAYAILTVAGTTRLYSINVGTGAATVATTGNFIFLNTLQIRGFTVGLGF